MAGMHVVFGTGAIGLALIDQLVADDVPVRAVNRSGAVGVPAEVEVLAGNVADAEFALRAAAGATVLYQCLCPPYHQWASDFPRCRTRSSTQPSRSGRDTYRSRTPTCTATPAAAPSPRPRPCVRPRARARFVGRWRNDSPTSMPPATSTLSPLGPRTISPRGTDQSPLGDLVIGAALAGKPARVVGDPSQPHSYTFTFDAASTLAALGTRPDLAGQVFHVPNAPAISTGEIIELIGRRVGHPVKISVAPRALLRIMGVFNNTIRELDEMRYEFTQPFIVDSSKAEQELGLSATPLEQAIDTTIDWFRNRPTS